MSISNIFQETKLKLTGKSLKVIVITILFTILSYALSSINFFIPIDNTYISTIFSIIAFIIEIPLSYGYTVSLIKLYRDEKVKIFDFISLGLASIKKVWCLTLLIVLKLLPYSILAAVTNVIGIICNALEKFTLSSIFSIAGVIFLILYIYKTIDYIFATYILFDNTKSTYKEITKMSANLIKNLKIKYILLNLLLILPFVLLIVITLFLVNYINYGIFIALPLAVIIFFLLEAYISFSWITFYEEAKDINSAKISEN